MTEFLSEYGLFLAKAVTIVVAILTVVTGCVALAARGRKDDAEGHVEVINLNDELDHMRSTIEDVVLSKEQLKALHKEEKKKAKAEAKARKKSPEPDEKRKRVFVLDFDGDVRASAVEPLREEITAILTLADEEDEVVVRLESPGGMVHEYGLASSQLERIKRKGIPLTVCVDRVAASGGYMMACLADRLIAAPFAVVGSIGVVAQLPNFHRLLKKHDIDYEVLTAGEYKRTLTVFGENTEKGREKFVEELEETHALFKTFVGEFRPQVDMDKVATGEVWYGRQALENHLVDELSTSDDYLIDACEHADVYLVSYEEKKTLQDRLADFAADAGDRVVLRWLDRLARTRFAAK